MCIDSQQQSLVIRMQRDIVTAGPSLLDGLMEMCGTRLRIILRRVCGAVMGRINTTGGGEYA